MLDRNALQRVYAAHVTDGAPTPDDHLAGLEAVAMAARAERADVGTLERVLACLHGASLATAKAKADTASSGAYAQHCETIAIVDRMLTEARARQPQPDRPALRHESLGETGDAVSICNGCDEERDEPHTWEDCAARLRTERDTAIDVASRAEALAPRERDASLESMRFGPSPEGDAHEAVEAGERLAARVAALPGDLRLPIRIGTAHSVGEAAYVGHVRALANVVEELVRREIARSTP
jgi:hypothetical protein